MKAYQFLVLHQDGGDLVQVGLGKGLKHVVAGTGDVLVLLQVVHVGPETLREIYGNVKFAF